MADGETAAGGDAVPLSGSRKSGRESEKKWRQEVIAPRLLRRAVTVAEGAAAVGARPEQLGEFRRHDDPKPHPGKARPAKRLGLGPRRAQRHIAALKGVGASDLPPNGGPLESSLDPGKQNPGRIPNGRGGPGVYGEEYDG